MTNPFVFIVGCPRSGTTLFRRMVDAHPQLAIIPEIGWISRRYENREGLTPEGMITPSFIGILKDGFGRFTPLPVSLGEVESLLASPRPVSYAEIITLMFDRYGESRGKSFVGNKTPEHVFGINTLHSLWPQAKFVHLIRDGRDVCLSAINWRRATKLAERFRTWEKDPLSTAALWWEWHVRMGRESGSSLGHQLYYEMSYESLVANPAEECSALCAFLGIPYDEAMLRFYEGKVKTDSALDAKHAWLPPTPGLRDWRTQMSSQDVERFEAVAGDLLEELGYTLKVERIPDERLKYAVQIRSLFEGSPLPHHWSPQA